MRILVFLFLFLIQGTSFAEESPGKVVKQTVDQVLDVLRDEDLEEDRKREIVYKLVSHQIDFNSMSMRILATNWKKARDEQKAKFVMLFEKILLQTYWTRMRKYSGERVEYLAVTRDSNDFATVDTIIVRNEGSPEIPISYRLKLNGDKWLAYDFMVESLSLVQSFNREYNATINNHGINGLLEYMQSQINNI